MGGQKDQEDAELAQAIANSQADGPVVVDSASSAGEQLPRRVSTLLRSFCTLLVEQSTLDKELLTERNSTLQALAFHTAGWIDWSDEDLRLATAEAEFAASVAAWKAAQDAWETEAAEAIVDGKEPPAKLEEPKQATADDEPTSSSFALQLRDRHGVAFVHYLLGECLIHPDPVTHVNTALFQTPLARRVCFTLLEIMSRHTPANLRVLLEWLDQAHGAAKQRRVQADAGLGTNDKLEWDIDPAEAQRSSTGFVGLKNQAATCYQNSLLQQIFHAVDFREALMDMREPDEMGDEKKAESALTPADHSSSRSSSSTPSPSASGSQSLLARVQTIFFHLLHSRKKFYDPIDFVETFLGADGERPYNPKEQQDVQEFCNLLFDRLENCFDSAQPAHGSQTEMKLRQAATSDSASAASSSSSSSSSSSPNLMKSYFRGTFQNELLCEEYPNDARHKRGSQEPFYIMQLDLGEGVRSLKDCLERFVAGEELDGVQCEFCARKRKTRKRCLVHRWPRLVVFHLKRFTFDMETMRTKKLHTEISFPLEIDLEPYTESGMAEKEKADKLGLTRDEAKQYEQHQAQHARTECDPTINFPCQKCQKQSIVHCADCSASFCEIHDIEAHAVAPTSAEDPALLYRLVGVLVHMGHAEGGHYYSYIRNRRDPTQWHEFNDTLITPFDQDHLAREAFGGVEDGAADAVNTDGTAAETARTTKRGKKNKAHKADDEWPATEKMEKNRSAYLLFYEKIEPQGAAAEEKKDSSPDPPSVLSSQLSALSLSAASGASVGSSSSSPSIPPSASLPSYLRSLPAVIERENQSQLEQEMFLESAYMDAVYKIARANVDQFLGKKTKGRTAATGGDAQESESSSGELASSVDCEDEQFIPVSQLPASSRYLTDIDAELDTASLPVAFLQNMTFFLFDTVARAKNSHRLDDWCLLLQHGYLAHVGCCQWLLERFILHPGDLRLFLLDCPSAATRKALCNLFEVLVKRLIPFEIDEEYSIAKHVVLPPMKELGKRKDAQAGLAAALAGDTPNAQASSVVDASSSSSVASSSSSGSFFSSALVQSACVPAQSAPEGLFKPTAKSTVAVSAKIAVLEGVGKGTEKQLNGVGVKTVQQLAEMTPKQREMIDRAPTGGMTQAQLQALVDQAKRAIDFILDESGVTATMAEEKRRVETEKAKRRAAAGSAFVGPKILPAFLRTCLQVLEAIVTTKGEADHACPELCVLLTSLAKCNPLMLRLLVELGAVDTCVAVITSPITTHEALKAAAAADKLEAGEIDQASQPADEKKSSSTSEDDSEDYMTNLEDLSYLEMVGLVDVLVAGCTTKGGQVGVEVQLLDDTAMSSETWVALRSANFFRRLCLQISAAKRDAPSLLAAHLVWESMPATDRLVDALFFVIQEYDFYDFYAAIKILQYLLLHAHDSLHEYRVQLCLPRLLQVTKANQDYYKATELCIKAFLHLVQHDTTVFAWTKAHEADCRWMDDWLGKNRRMPEVHKKDSAAAAAAGSGSSSAPSAAGGSSSSVSVGVARHAVKHDKTAGVGAKWQADWDEQIRDFGIGLGAMDNLTDYQKIFRKCMLLLKTRKG